MIEPSGFSVWRNRRDVAGTRRTAAPLWSVASRALAHTGGARSFAAATAGAAMVAPSPNPGFCLHFL